jgi:hypothetical protein
MESLRAMKAALLSPDMLGKAVARELQSRPMA